MFWVLPSDKVEYLCIWSEKGLTLGNVFLLMVVSVPLNQHHLTYVRFIFAFHTQGSPKASLFCLQFQIFCTFFTAVINVRVHGQFNSCKIQNMNSFEMCVVCCIVIEQRKVGANLARSLIAANQDLILITTLVMMHGGLSFKSSTQTNMHLITRNKGSQRSNKKG